MKQPENLQPGFYWVIFGGKPIVAEWTGLHWYITSVRDPFVIEEFDGASFHAIKPDFEWPIKKENNI